MSMTAFTVLATGPGATAAEFEPLRAAGLDLVIGRPLDAPDRRPSAHVVNPDAVARWRERRG